MEKDKTAEEGPDMEAQRQSNTMEIKTGEVRLETGEIVNASGHVQELERNFVSKASRRSMTVRSNSIELVPYDFRGRSSRKLLGSYGCYHCAKLLVKKTGNCTDHTQTLSMYNGGSPGMIYEFIVVSVMYAPITANLAELASAIPSSAGVYHWASVTPGPYFGRVVGFFAGYWNCLAYALGSSSLSSLSSQCILQMWSIHHETYVFERWHGLLIYFAIIGSSALVVLFRNRWLPVVNSMFMVVIVVGWLISIVAVAVLPGQNGKSHASNSFVWKEWQNNSGYSSNGLVFVLGMLNGAYNIGVPDCSTHLAEEVPRPSVNVPIVMGVQMMSSCVTGLTYMIVLLYAVSDFSAVLQTTASFPLTEIYLQATGSTVGATFLTSVVLITLIGTVQSGITASSRAFWTLARDGATPFSHVFDKVNPRWKNPFNAILITVCFNIVMGGVYLGSDTAFQAFGGCAISLLNLSYLASILPFWLQKRATVTAGPFFMNRVLGFAMGATSTAFLLVWVVVFCFPFSLPVDAQSMNYTSLMMGGLTILIGAWWFVIQKTYKGPHVIMLGGKA